MEIMKTKKNSVITKSRAGLLLIRIMSVLLMATLIFSSSAVAAEPTLMSAQVQPGAAGSITVAGWNTPQVANTVYSANTVEKTAIAAPVAAQAVAKKTTPVYVYNLSESDKQLLLRIGMAEAGNQGPDGIGLVMQTVLNRLYHPGHKFPNNIHDIIYSPNQYTTKYYKPNKDCYTALEYLLQGRYVAWSKGAIAFAGVRGGKWHDRNLKHLFTYKGHKFYKFR